MNTAKILQDISKQQTILVIALIFILSSCASYKGSIDYSIPFSEQATLVIPGVLTVREFDGIPVWWAKAGGASFGGNLYVNIPAGEHFLEFDYRSVSEHRSGNYIYTTTSTASGLSAEGKFEAGNTYRAALRYLSGNRVQVVISLEEEGEAIDTFKSRESQIFFSLGGTAESMIGTQMGYRIGMVYDGSRRTAWNVEMGYEFGLWPLSVGFFAGGNYEYYFSRESSWGMSLGGGIAWPLFSMFPYAKIGAVRLTDNGSKIIIYGAYYFTDALMMGDAAYSLFGSEDQSNFSFGISFSM